MKESPCVLVCVLILYLRCSSCDDQKCTSRGLIVKRHFYVGEHDLTFRIEVSKRISHLLVSHILRILLKEALGYEHVNLEEQETDNTVRTLQKISSCDSPDKKCGDVDETGPEYTINLELWLYPGFNLEKWITTGRIEDCGPLGPIGRVGWFIERRIVKSIWEKNGTIVDHFRSFLNPEVTARFDLSSDNYVLGLTQKTCNDLKDPQKYGCEADGFYKPPKCQVKGVRCATILTDYPQTTFDTLRNMILRYELLVNIAFLGDKFESSLIQMIGDTDKNILFFHKVPMILSGVNKFTHVKFPDCEDDLLKCEFEVNQMQKVVWKEVKNSAPLAFDVVRAMSFTQEQYNSLLDSYLKTLNRRYTFYNVACDWVNDNQYIWTDWIPGDAEKKTTLYIGGIFPHSGIYWKQNSTLEAAKMAAADIRNNDSILVDYDLEILDSDGRCATDEVMKSFIQYVRSEKFKTTIGILGPACSDTVEPIAGVAKHFNSIIISYSAEGSLFNSDEKEDKYRFFFRTIPENSIFRFVYLKLFKELDFHRVAALTEEGQKYPQYLSYLQDLMKSHEMTFIENRKFPKERAYSNNMTMYLEDLNRKGARIIIGDFYDYAARSVMCTALKLHMTAAHGYVWFLPSWYPSDWYDTEYWNNIHNATENVNCTKDEMIEAINGHISLSYKFFADNESIMQDQITVGEWIKNYKQTVKNAKKLPSPYAGYAYDAVWVYALALNNLLKENASHVATIHSDKTAKRFVQLLRETQFNGVSGPLSFQNGSRISDVIILQWINGSHHEIGIYNATSPEDGELILYPNRPTWLTPNARKPLDHTEVTEYCPVEGFRSLLDVKCETAKIVANVIGLISFAFAVFIAIIVYKRRYDKRLKITEKRMKEMGLLGDRCSFGDFELPRNQIVINRKLGEGAFGNVYGGEAFIPNKGWIAVAVKTLKGGAKIDEKLDFLGEAEIMKQFDHINIVKLIGVCTTEDPVYTIMEFMLYGDLKFYLLSRRQMATESDRSTNEEVSDRRLTNMAMDIARGLSYLADKKFVHRDLACRNCLVNSSRSVKIADFGMCRSMFDKDYYKYHKKGMLPIRWMAPESVLDGVFTPMSDVWSYGVVLYEIITFASCPYQGFSQDQVLDHLKSGKPHPIPKGCKPTLEMLLRQCWARDPAERPPAAGIVELLASDSELITPCLDVPAAALGDAEEALAVKVRERGRVHSFSSVWQSRMSPPLDPNHPGCFDKSLLVQAGLETGQKSKHSGFKSPHKKSLHESFKKAKRNLRKDRTQEDSPQITYL